MKIVFKFFPGLLYVAKFTINNLDGDLFHLISLVFQVPGPRSVRSSIIRLLHLIVEEGISNADDGGLRSNLWSQAANLTDILLDALKMYLDSCEENPSMYAQAKQEVQAERGAMLELFLKGREFERAALLAEKYIDFSTLLTVCDETMNEDKLNVYIDKLGDSGFTEFACKW